MRSEKSALLTLPEADRGEATRPKKQSRASKRITMRQATNLIEAVRFARMISLPLVAHLTIHWSLTDAGDDPDGKLFAKMREGLDKWLQRHGVEVRGSMGARAPSRRPVRCRALPPALPLAAGIPHWQEVASGRGRDYSSRRAARRWHPARESYRLRVHDNPDGKYLIKGGGPKIWNRFGIRKKHRRLQGLIFGKRCGTTENIGPAARSAKRSQQHHQISRG